MKYQLVIIGFNLSVLFLSGQAPTLEWQRCYGGTGEEVPNSVVQTSDHGYIIAGSTNSNDGDVTGLHTGSICGPTPCFDGWVLKIDSLGSIQWENALGGSSFEGFANALMASNHGYALAANTGSNNGDVSGINGSSDFWFVKLDSLGNLAWQHCYGGSLGEDLYTIFPTSDHGYILTGATASNDSIVSGNHSLDGDIWVLKLDSMGNFQWQKCIGGTLLEIGHCGRQTFDGGYIIAGYATSNDGDIMYNSNNPNNLHKNACLIKLDSLGDIQFSKTFGGSGEDEFNSVIQVEDSGYVVVGSTTSNDFDVMGNHSTLQTHDIWVIRTDKNGIRLNRKCLGGSQDDYGITIQQTVEGGYIVCGKTLSADYDVTNNHGWSDAWIVKLDTALNIEWEECLGGSFQDDGYAIIQNYDQSYTVACYSESNDQQVSGNHGGDGDLWVAKLSQAINSIPEFENTITNLNAQLNNTINQLSLNFFSRSYEELNIMIYDLTGRILFKQEIQPIPGKNQYLSGINHLSDGIYLVQLQSKDGTVVQKIVAR